MKYPNATLWYVVFLLTLASTLSFIDRQILNVMIGPIKRDLGGLSDTEISLIIGLAFSAVYSLTTLPLARIADRYSRRNVIAAGIFSWSLMTALAGMANSFWALFGARMGVGVGEASLGPATQSILADYFEQHRLPLAYGIVAAAPFIGTGLANIVGGPLIDYLEARPLIVMPVFGEMYSWQTVLVVVGLPGILLTLLMFTIKEPKRSGASADRTEGYSYRELWQFCLSRRKYLTYHFIAYLCLSIQGFAFLTWIVEFFVRIHGWTRTEIGLTYGSIALIVGIMGSIGAGYYAGYWLAKGRADAPMRLAFYGTIGLGPLAVIMPLVSSDWLAIAIIIPITFFMAMPPGLSNAALQAISPNRLRGQMIAVYLICVSFLSYLFAPLIIGLMNDYVFGREDAIGLSLSSLAFVNYAIAAVCLYLCLDPLKDAVSRVREFAED
ncbi:MAG: MFS transporter [Gammaproteobacteria bacterium]|jgi:MFS family permease|nr:MFS transporter [Gammaproteobacteria bacterium]MBT3866932.1 MFS transporter [Gammaproteobacteria bacterium]MBT4380753.1 MFS transporter [Gammaproteobacteria bacterium]MBT4617738.1 MFS transporter [Gammaproteobacteria bacterium]MBT5198225.1 MFS transporter [Gammaproteobacteria bacterium]